MTHKWKDVRNLKRTHKWKDVRNLKRKLRRIFSGFKHKVWGGYKNGGLLGMYHWVRCHIWNRYHIINISGQDRYDYGWIDSDNVMYLACFSILQDFVEKEDPEVGTRNIDDYMKKDVQEEFPEGVEQIRLQLEGDREIRALYDWWTKGRKEEHDKLDVLQRGKFEQKRWEAWMKMSDALEEKDDEMLLRLIKIRKRLWT